MSTTHTRVTIGTKPLDAIIAEFKQSIPAALTEKPDGPGWIELGELMAAMKMSKSSFRRVINRQLADGTWERFAGTKLTRAGRRQAVYFRVRKPAKKTA